LSKQCLLISEKAKQSLVPPVLNQKRKSCIYVTWTEAKICSLIFNNNSGSCWRSFWSITFLKGAEYHGLGM